MLSIQDITQRSVIIVNALDNKKFNMVLGNIVVQDDKSGEILTKLSCYKVLAIFVIGHITITSHVLENLAKYSICLVLLKSNFRPFFTFGISAEANYLLRQRQYGFTDDYKIAKVLLHNKSYNQVVLLKKIRSQDIQNNDKFAQCKKLLLRIKYLENYSLAELMGIEGNISKNYFSLMFDCSGWNGRKPRTKIDPYNVTLDIGYTFLFNFIECCVRLFGFDVYYGVCHQTWFRRKSLICDLIEPFRCIIVFQIRKSWNLNQFQFEHFEYVRGQYQLKKQFNKLYTEIIFSQIIEYKNIIFMFIRDYYRCFMGKKSVAYYPWFDFSDGSLVYADSQL